MNHSDHPTRCGSCAIIGATNAGKSTLMNTLVEAKVSIVSRKVQTTRCRINGIYTNDDTQIIFVDTPGLFDPKRPLERAMIDEIWRTISDVDVVLVLVDAAAATNPPDFTLLDLVLRHRRSDQPILLALNKCDAVHPKAKLIELAAAYNAHHSFDHTLMIAGKKGEGVDDLIRAIAGHLPSSPFLYPPDMVTDIPMKLMAAEITREHIFDRLHQELPYQTMVETTEFDDVSATTSVTIHQNIIVARDGHKGIIIGAKGQTLKQIGAAARAAMQDAFERKVHLFLHVIVDEKWEQKAERLRSIGLLI